MDRDLPARTSALRLRKLPLADLERLECRLRRFCRNPLGRVTADWLRAGCLSGLRPCEWSAAVLSGTSLHVVNRKVDGGLKGNGPCRTLDLSALSPPDLACVARMCAIGAGWELQGEFGLQQERCAALLYDACLAIWPAPHRRHYGLYSARQQSVATAKSDGLSTLEVAALHGHAVERTALRHYGRPSAGWRGERPGAARPDPADVARVRRPAAPVPAPEAAPAEICAGVMPTC